jgi:hypothetical protein
MGVISRIEETKDLQQVVMQTITQQDTSQMTPSEDARTYRQDQVDGIWTLTEEHLISQGAGTWSSDGSVSSEPLESHRQFVNISSRCRDLWATWKRNPSDEFLNRAEYQIDGKPWNPAKEVEDDDFIIFYSYIRDGIESWLCPRLTARFTELEDGPPDTTNLGLIDGKPSSIFGYGTNYWLLSGVRSQQEGNMWRNTYEYLGAGPNGAWDEGLYTIGGGG